MAENEARIPLGSVAAIRDQMANKGVTLGSWMQIDSPSVAEIMGAAGYDWVAVDLEHGQFSLAGLPNIFRALSLGNTLPFARLARGGEKEIKQALDAGAKGLIIPKVASAEMMENCMAWAFYPPKGTRGVGYSRANLFGKRFDQYANSHGNGIFMVAQIESMAGVDHLPKILAVQGLDAIIIGPYDLSGSMGMTAEFDRPEFKAALKRIQKSCREAKKACGIHVVLPDEKDLADKITQGYQFIAYGIDAVFLYSRAESPGL
jgi:2-dehydro-3-deoxyglucarate aldolase